MPCLPSRTAPRGSYAVNSGRTLLGSPSQFGSRRPVVTPDKLRKAREHIASGLTVREAATRPKIGKTALDKALEVAENGAKPMRS